MKKIEDWKVFKNTISLIRKFKKLITEKWAYGTL